MIGVCPKCGEQTDLGSRVGAKVGGVALGAVLGGCSTRHWLGVPLGALLGAAIGHVIDEEVLPSCSQCRVALEIIDAVL
jgi:outer membrane lipoprotein SlyB